MEVVLEVLGTTNNVLDRQRFTAGTVRIGRGFGNDLVIADDHVDVDHAELILDEEGRCFLRDLNSVNGVRRVKARGLSLEDPVSSGDIFLLGRSKVRVYFQNHPLPDAVPIRPIESLLLLLGRPPALVTLLLLTVFLGFAGAYNSNLEEFNWSDFLSSQLLQALAFLGLAAVVYLISVLFRRSGNFPSHLSVLMFITVLSACIAFTLKIARYNGGDHSYEVIGWIDSISGYLILFLYFWSILYLAFNLSLRVRTAISATVVAIVVLLTPTFRGAAERFGPRNQFPLERVFMPAAFQWASPLESDEYVAHTRTLFDDVDERREELLEERAEREAGQ